MVPIVVFDQIYSFHREELIKAIPKPEKDSAKEFGAASEELFDRIMQMTDNAGATDDHRALNYLAVRYPAIYTTTALLGTSLLPGRSSHLNIDRCEKSCSQHCASNLQSYFSFAYSAFAEMRMGMSGSASSRA